MPLHYNATTIFMKLHESWCIKHQNYIGIINAKARLFVCWFVLHKNVATDDITTEDYGTEAILITLWLWIKVWRTRHFLGKGIKGLPINQTLRKVSREVPKGASNTWHFVDHEDNKVV